MRLFLEGHILARPWIVVEGELLALEQREDVAGAFSHIAEFASAARHGGQTNYRVPRSVLADTRTAIIAAMNAGPTTSL
jgi:hypothetical protein